MFKFFILPSWKKKTNIIKLTNLYYYLSKLVSVNKEKSKNITKLYQVLEMLKQDIDIYVPVSEEFPVLANLCFYSFIAMLNASVPPTTGKVMLVASKSIVNSVPG